MKPMITLAVLLAVAGQVGADNNPNASARDVVEGYVAGALG